MNNYIKVAILLVIAALVIIFIPKGKKDDTAVNPADVKDFFTCSEAGYPILDSFPAQCKTPDGRTYVEDINEHVEVMVDSPAQGAIVSSPLAVTGKARGTWFFEANLPVTLKDQNGKVLAHKGAQATENWMTEDFVNFTTTLEFSQPETDFGVLLIEKDNPSGLPENDSSYAVPVRFK